MNQLQRIPFLVIGGGIGGLTTTLALARKGYPVHLLEKAHEFGEIGAGIQIVPNGSRMLDELGILAELRTNAVYPQGHFASIKRRAFRAPHGCSGRPASLATSFIAMASLRCSAMSCSRGEHLTT